MNIIASNIVISIVNPSQRFPPGEARWRGKYQGGGDAPKNRPRNKKPSADEAEDFSPPLH